MALIYSGKSNGFHFFQVILFSGKALIFIEIWTIKRHKIILKNINVLRMAYLHELVQNANMF